MTALTKLEKLAAIQKLREFGFTMIDIAELFCANVRTIYEWQRPTKNRNYTQTYAVTRGCPVKWEHKLTLQRAWRAKNPSYNKDWIASNPRRAWTHSAVKNCKLRARERHAPCTVTYDFLESLWDGLNGKCPVFGTEFLLRQSVVVDQSPTVDAMIPSLGYVPGNVSIISAKANRIKNDATANEIYAVAKWLDSISTRTTENNRPIR